MRVATGGGILKREGRDWGRLNLLCTFQGGHWIRGNIQYDHRKVVCLFNKRTQRVRDGHCGNEVGTLRRDIEIYIYIETYRNQPQWYRFGRRAL